MDLPDPPATVDWKTMARWVVGVIVAALICVATKVVIMREDR